VQEKQLLLHFNNVLDIFPIFLFFVLFGLSLLQALFIRLLAASCDVFVLYLEQSNNDFIKKKESKKEGAGYGLVKP